MCKKFFATFLALTIILCIAHAQTREQNFFNQECHQADSAFNTMTFEEKILQLYIFDARKKILPTSGYIPSGAIFCEDSLHLLKQKVKNYKQKASTPVFCIADISYPFKNLPIYTNILAAKATKDNQLIDIFTQKFSDTIASTGINFVCGLFKDFIQEQDNFDTTFFYNKLKFSNNLIKAFEQKNISTFIDQTPPLPHSAKNIFAEANANGAIAISTNYDPKIKNFNGLTTYYVETIEDLQLAIKSNNDLIVSTLQPAEFIRATKKLLKGHRKTRLAAYNKIKRILRLKYWQQNTQNTITKTNKYDNNLLVRKFTQKSISCLCDKYHFLPIKSLSEIEIIQIGEKEIPQLQNRIKCYCNNVKFTLIKNEYEKIHEQLMQKHSKPLILILTGIIDNPYTIKLINQIFANADKCVVNTGDIYNISNLNVSSLIQTYDDGEQTGDCLAQILFGGMPCSGVFPMQGFRKFPENNAITLTPNRIGYYNPEEVGFNPKYLDSLNILINNAIDSCCFPGCQIYAAIDGKVFCNRSFGHFTYDSISHAVENSDLYDIASLTKICAPTIAAIYLHGNKQLDMNQTLGSCFKNPEIDWSNLPGDTAILPRVEKGKLLYDTLIVNRKIPETTIYDVTIRQLLEHRSGIKPSLPLYYLVAYKTSYKKLLKKQGINIDTIKKADLEKQAFDYYFSTQKDSTAQTRVRENLWLKNSEHDTLETNTKRLPVSETKKYVYSDVNMVLLQRAEDTLLSCPTDSFLINKIYRPMGMYTTCYTPYKYFEKQRIAPTERCFWTNEIIQGDVHDPTAALLGGVAGNAGLFSNANDLGILFQMILNGGQYGGKRYLDSASIAFFTQRQQNLGRALGFDLAPNAYTADKASTNTFGHTGFTGTCLWTDPQKKIIIVFLSNRVYPTSTNTKINTLKIRKKICNILYEGFQNQL